MSGKVSLDGGISPKQQRFLAALLGGLAITVAARAAGISEKTAHQWLNQPCFKQALKDARGRAFDDALSILRETVKASISTILTLMRDTDSPPGVRLRAAQILLEQSIEVHKLAQLEARLEALETRE